MMKVPHRHIGTCVAQLAEERGGDRFATFIRRGSREDITFSDLFVRSEKYARALAAKGVKPGDIVVVMLEQTPQLFYSFVGAILAGATPTLMPFPNPKQRRDLFLADHRQLFQTLQPSAIVTFGELVGLFGAYARAIDGTCVADQDGSGEIRETEQGHAASIAYLQHSSGTTALKKGVMLTHEAIAAQAEAYATAIRLCDDDVIVSWLPFYHDMGFIACFMMPLLFGTRVVVLDPFEWTLRPQLLLDAIAEERGTLSWLPNFAFAHLANRAPRDTDYDLSSLRALINCSEPCKSFVFEKFLERFRTSGISRDQLQVCYAMAENVFAVTQTTLRETVPSQFVEDGSRMLSCGRPIEGVEVRICSQNGDDAGDGTVGEILIASPFLFSGYYKREDATARAFAGKWYKTGDLGFLLEGDLYVTGRVDDLLILNGRNYYAHEIEDIVNETPGVVPGRSLAISVDVEESGITGLVVLAEFEEAEKLDALRQRIRASLFERIGLGVHKTELLPRGTLVKSTSGKLSRKKNADLYAAGKYNGRLNNDNERK